MLIRYVQAIAAAALAGQCLAAPAMPPQLSPDDQAEYQAYIEAPDHRAFAIAPGGAWGWVAGQADVARAEEKALAACQAQTSQRCVAYAVDARTVFDAEAWPHLWRPYATTEQARRAATGSGRGQRFPDLVFTDSQGVPHSVGSLRGKVVVVHFWGAWCPPCRRELPDLQKLLEAMANRKDVVFLLLQAREKFEVSRAWAAKQGIHLPLSDSGATGEDDAKFRLADGGTINDREIASRFPTTYVLDRNGLVVFSHVGPVSGWFQYAPFLRDVADRSGKKWPD